MTQVLTCSPRLEMAHRLRQTLLLKCPHCGFRNEIQAYEELKYNYPGQEIIHGCCACLRPLHERDFKKYDVEDLAHLASLKAFQGVIVSIKEAG